MSLLPKELSESGLDTLILSERKRVVAPLTEWRTLSLALREEGLLRTPEAGSFAGASSASTSGQFEQTFEELTSVRRRANPLRWGVRAFASIALLGSGVLIGRSWTIGEELVPIIKTAIVADSAGSAELVSHDFESTDEALRVLNRAQSEYQQAAAFLSVHNNGGLPMTDLPDLRERLAALDAVVAAAQSAMQESPGDPLVTQYYMSSSGARKATLQLLNQNLPDGTRLAGY